MTQDDHLSTVLQGVLDGRVDLDEVLEGRLPRRGRGKARKTVELIDACYAILAEIQPASVRAVCYQLFNRKLIASMKKIETNRVGNLLTRAREDGTIPWEWIVDEKRTPERVNAFENPEAYIAVVQRAYRRDYWVDQPEWVEVWSEKGTIRGSLAPILDEYGVTFRVMHGYGSATAVHDAAMETQGANRRLTALYVGDWDPSGLHMSAADLPRRLERYHANIDIERIALLETDTPTLPSFDAETKRGDPRHRWFTERYGARCWELDAMNPNDLRTRVKKAIISRLDLDAWDRAGVAEKAERESLEAILQNWPTSISAHASKYSPDQPGGAR